LSQRELLEQLKQYPVFQNWRAKAECHQLKYRPTESAELKRLGLFEQVIDQRTEMAWNTLVDAKAAGANQHEAEEVALSIILLPEERDDEDDDVDEDFDPRDPSDDWTIESGPITTLVTLINGRLLSKEEFYRGLREWRRAALGAEAGTVLDDPFIYKDELLRPVADRHGALQVQVWNRSTRRWEKGKPGSLQKAMRGKPASPEDLRGIS
jgi:hypothetical protein